MSCRQNVASGVHIGMGRVSAGNTLEPGLARTVFLCHMTPRRTGSAGVAQTLALIRLRESFRLRLRSRCALASCRWRLASALTGATISPVDSVARFATPESAPASIAPLRLAALVPRLLQGQRPVIDESTRAGEAAGHLLLTTVRPYIPALNGGDIRRVKVNPW